MLTESVKVLSKHITLHAFEVYGIRGFTELLVGIS